MLFFLPVLSAFYLADRSSKKYMGVLSDKVTLGLIDRATDFEPIKGTVPSLSLVLQDPVSKKVLDQSGGTDKLIAWAMHKLFNQCFRIVLTADNTHLLMSSGKCLKYIESSQSFLRINCSAGPTEFDVLYEVSYVKRMLDDHLFVRKHHHRHHRDSEARGYPYIQSGFYLNKEDRHNLGPYTDSYLGTHHIPRLNSSPYNERYVAYGRTY